MTVLLRNVSFSGLQNGLASYSGAFHNSLVSTGSLESRLFGARDRILLDLMDPLLQRYNIFVGTFDEWYLLDEQWIAPVDLGNDLMNHHARLVDLAIEPSLLCSGDGISTVELLQHVVTSYA